MPASIQPMLQSPVSVPVADCPVGDDAACGATEMGSYCHPTATGVSTTKQPQLRTRLRAEPAAGAKASFAYQPALDRALVEGEARQPQNHVKSRRRPDLGKIRGGIRDDASCCRLSCKGLRARYKNRRNGT